MKLGILGSLLLVGTANAAPLEWPQWRGPGGQGHGEANDLPRQFDAETHVAWHCPIPGRGWSSPVLAGDRIWVTTAHEVEATEAEVEDRLKDNTGVGKLTVRAEVKWHAVCVDRATGKLLHDVFLFNRKNPQWVHDLNSYASPSPVTDGKRVVVHFGSYGTACLDAQSGEVLWTNRENLVMHENGPGASPILWNDRVLFSMDGSDKQWLLCLDLATGKEIWKVKRTGELRDNPQLRKTYTTPMVVELDGKEVLLSQGADWLYAYDPKDGNELWKFSYGELGFSLSGHPVLVGERLVFSTGFMKPRLLAADLRADAPPQAAAWIAKRGVPTMGSPIAVDGLVYYVSDRIGMLTCLDAKTGEEVYRQRLGGDFSSSPVYADGALWVGNREGEVTVFEAGRTFQELGKGTLPGRLMATPVPAGDSLYVRTTEGLYRVKK